MEERVVSTLLAGALLNTSRNFDLWTYSWGHTLFTHTNMQPLVCPVRSGNTCRTAVIISVKCNIHTCGLISSAGSGRTSDSSRPYERLIIPPVSWLMGKGQSWWRKGRHRRRKGEEESKRREQWRLIVCFVPLWKRGKRNASLLRLNHRDRGSCEGFGVCVCTCVCVSIRRWIGFNPSRQWVSLPIYGYKESSRKSSDPPTPSSIPTTNLCMLLDHIDYGM